MRKKLMIAAAIILLLLFCFAGFLQYRQYSSYKIPVHSGAHSIVKINTDAFLKILVKEYGFDFKRKIINPNRKKKESLGNTGIYLPGNIFIYNISSKDPTTFFCTLPVYDLEDFKVFAEKNLKIRWGQNAALSSGTHPDGKISMACTANFVSIGWSSKKEDVLGTLKDILQSKNLLSKQNETVNTLKEQEAPVVIISGNSLLSFDFSGNEMLLLGSLDSLKNLQTGSIKQRQNKTEAFAFLSFAAKPGASLFKKKYELKNYQVETDSILKYFGGYADFELGPAITQTDTITTYEYDDNFEKIEKQSLTAVMVPDIHFSLMAKPGLLRYLQQQQIVTTGMKLNKEIFPLYNVAVNQTAGMLDFTTGIGNKAVPDTFINKVGFLNLKMDVQQTADVFAIPYLQDYIKNIVQIELTATQKKTVVQLEAIVRFNGSATKALVDILKSL
ncbi:MAG: hypothetical protein H7X88_01935 [Gloeobacteraceae cyanobacterium ES-bin-316]|nr:hypothetical protein [Ferruginibacter sp.]